MRGSQQSFLIGLREDLLSNRPLYCNVSLDTPRCHWLLIDEEKRASNVITSTPSRQWR